MPNRISNLANTLSERHPELLTYYELSKDDRALNLEGLVKVYDLDERYKTSFIAAVYATYLSIKDRTKKKETLERLEIEYNEIKQRLARKP